MKKLFIILACLLATPAFAQPATVDRDEGSSEFVFKYKLDGSEVFRLLPGGCMIGPLIFFDMNHREIFRIEAGASYPAGCQERVRLQKPAAPESAI